MDSEEDWKRVANAVRQRRNDRRWTQMDIATRGPLSLDRVQHIEGARSTRYSPRTITNLERALDWERGSVQAILDGGEPTPKGEAAPTLGPRRNEAQAREAEESDLRAALHERIDEGIAEILEIPGLTKPEREEMIEALYGQVNALLEANRMQLRILRPPPKRG